MPYQDDGGRKGRQDFFLRKFFGDDPRRPISNQEFDDILEWLVQGLPAHEILQIPGVYELISEHLNNEVLEEWEKRMDDRSQSV